MPYTKVKRPSRKPRLILLAAVFGVMVIVLVILEITDTTHLFHQAKINYGSGTIPSKTPKPTDSDTIKASGSSQSSTTSTKQADTPAEPTATTLSVPSGTFISNHRPSLSDNGHPSAVESQCQTSIGATCHLEFTKDGVVKKLSDQTVGTTGAVYWNWDTKTAGLTEGTWGVTAIAKLGDKTETATDQIALEVQP